MTFKSSATSWPSNLPPSSMALRGLRVRQAFRRIALREHALAADVVIGAPPKSIAAISLSFATASIAAT